MQRINDYVVITQIVYLQCLGEITEELDEGL